MNIIKQVKSSFGELEIDFYLDRNRNIFVTIEQLAQRFGYKSRNAIEKMIERQRQFLVTMLSLDPQSEYVNSISCVLYFVNHLHIENRIRMFF